MFNTRVVKYAQFLTGDEKYGVRHVVLQSGTVKEMASRLDKKEDRSIYGIRTFWMVHGTVMVDGKSAKVSSRELDPVTTYIDGQVMTLKEALASNPDNEALIDEMRSEGYTKAVITRDGSYLIRFDENRGDRNITLPK